MGEEKRPPPAERSLAARAASGAAVTMGAQLAKVAVQFGGIVLLARLLSPRDYGLVAMVMAIVGVGEILRDFGLSAAAVQAPLLSREQRDNLFWINTLFGSALGLAVYLGAGAIAALYKEPELRVITQVLALTFVFNGITTQFRAHLNRDMRFGRLASADVIGQVAGLAAAVAAALAGAGYWALVIQQLVQGIVILLLMVMATRWLPGLPHRGAQMGGLLNFGWALMATQLLAYASTNIGQVVIGQRLGSVALGQFNRAFALVTMPLNQINAPATSVALPTLSRLRGEPARYNAFLLRGQTVMVHFMVALFAVGCALAEPLILLVLGRQWQPAIPIFRILAIGGIFQMAAYAAYWVFLSKGLTGAQLRYAIVSRSFLIACIVTGSYWGVLGVASGYAVGTALLWPSVLWWIGRLSDAPAGRMFGNGARATLGYALCAAAAWLACELTVGHAPLLRLLAGATGAAAALALVCLLWPGFRRDVAEILGSRHLLRSA
ncbi:lipopolysaccharide biosynthesis protein [Pseudoxanthomonas wuyuanensis]